MNGDLNGLRFTFCGVELLALPSGALYLPDARTLCVSDLHLGKSGRRARLGGLPLPPYEIEDTLNRLATDIQGTDPARVICLGDSFDDNDVVGELASDQRDWIMRLMAGRHWVWIAGNHDPAPMTLAGSHQREYIDGGLTFRHIADPEATSEISGHYHPKATIHHRGRAMTQRCFLLDSSRLILPAYGSYTGGMRSTDRAFARLIQEEARAILLRSPPVMIPMPRGHR